MDAINLVRYCVALLFVAALAFAAILIKRYGANPGAFKGAIFKGALKDKLGKWDFAVPQRRLAVVESLMLGPKQRLLIVRRDNVEHLVLAGPDSASVIEANIPAANISEIAGRFAS
jgi:flagellar protein FliO/FliZ